MEVDSWLGPAAAPIVKDRRRILAINLLTPMPCQKIFTPRGFLGAEFPWSPPAQGIQIPCLPLPPSVSIAAQPFDLKTFGQLLNVAAAPVFPATRETQGMEDRKRSGRMMECAGTSVRRTSLPLDAAESSRGARRAAHDVVVAAPSASMRLLSTHRTAITEPSYSASIGRASEVMLMRSGGVRIAAIPTTVTMA
jgi:hypothetical protein